MTKFSFKLIKFLRAHTRKDVLNVGCITQEDNLYLWFNLTYFFIVLDAFCFLTTSVAARHIIEKASIKNT